MNQLTLTLPTRVSTRFEPVTDRVEWQNKETPAAPSEAPGAVTLMTRKMKPGTSIRRLRNHRCAWPRRA